MYPTSDEFDRMRDVGPDLAVLDEDVRRRLCRFAYETFLPEFSAGKRGNIPAHHFLVVDVHKRLKDWLGESTDYRADLTIWFCHGFIERVHSSPNVMAFWTKDLRTKLAADYIVSQFDKGIVINPDMTNEWQIHCFNDEWKQLLLAVMTSLRLATKDMASWVAATFFPAPIDDMSSITATKERVDHVMSVLRSVRGRYRAVLVLITRAFGNWETESRRRVKEREEKEGRKSEVMRKPEGPGESPQEYPDATVPHSHQVLLAEALTRFDITEIDALCLDAGIDYEDILRGTKAQYRRELSFYVARRGQLFGVLVMLVFRERPFLRQQTKFAELLRYDEANGESE